MIPGTTTKLSETTLASAASIDPQADVALVTGTTSIATITPRFFNSQFAGILFLIPTDGSVALLTTGNIAVAQTMIQNKVTVLIFSKAQQKWYPHALA